jgi:hypothetical protein
MTFFVALLSILSGLHFKNGRARISKPEWQITTPSSSYWFTTSGGHCTEHSPDSSPTSPWETLRKQTAAEYFRREHRQNSPAPSLSQSQPPPLRSRQPMTVLNEAVREFQYFASF